MFPAGSCMPDNVTLLCEGNLALNYRQELAVTAGEVRGGTVWSYAVAVLGMHLSSSECNGHNHLGDHHIDDRDLMWIARKAFHTRLPKVVCLSVHPGLCKQSFVCCQDTSLPTCRSQHNLSEKMSLQNLVVSQSSSTKSLVSVVVAFFFGLSLAVFLGL